ncbi:MAG: glutamate--tRNA ligase [Erysipelotrichaceae bacterium]|nr:glutamate--tRNA ligase [Erysipelotrichaceae bacterium]
MKKVRTRFAPSPTGYMHIGNLRTALFEYLIAKHENGDFILRIEDTDQEREVEGAVDIIYDTLAAVGLHHDEGPDVGGDFGPYIQSQRLPMYKEYADKLVDLGGAHYCFCCEEEIQEQRKVAESIGKAFKFDDPCKHMSIEEARERIQQGETYTVRQTIQPTGITAFEDQVYGRIEVDNNILDESVLLKSDGFPTYNFANIIDDHQMGITHVVRGNEYLSSTPKYNLIYEAFGWEIPTYIHVPPVMKDEQHKLSKRNGDASFQDLLQKGYLPQAVLNYIALLGWAPETEQEIYTLDELVKVFSIQRISRSGAIFDIDKLTWMNGMYLRAMDLESFHALAKPYLTQAIKRDVDLLSVSKILQQRTDILSQIPEQVDFIDELPTYDNGLYIHKKMKTTYEIALTALKAAYEALSALEDWSKEETIHDLLLSLPSALELKNGQVLWPIRTAITGKPFTPGGAIELAHILGKEETLKRITVGIEKLQMEEVNKNN